MTTARNYRRQIVLDAIDDYAAFLTAEQAKLEGRIANLKAALASVETRLDSAFSQGAIPHPLREELGLIRAAARGALEADDRENKTE